MMLSQRTTLSLALAGMMTASVAGAQLPPNIRKPIEAAQKAASKTSEQVRAAEKVGGDAKSGGMMPAEAAQKANVQKGGTAAPQKGGAAQKGGKAPANDTVTRGAAGTASRRGQVVFFREAFSYTDGGRRDPFVSLMASGELRPLITDLSLIGIMFDPSNKRSVALLLDASTTQTYKVKVGDALARMRVTAIGQSNITLNIDEFGFSRSETLQLVKKASSIAAPLRKTP